MTCAALLATFFAGVQISDLDKTHVYEIPASFMSQLSLVQKATAKTCAMRHGIKYRIASAS
jgi:hypothetical protein